MVGDSPVQLVTFCSSSSEFGSIVSMPSNCRTVVERMSTAVTIPCTPSTSTMSPTLILRSKSRMTPLIRLRSRVCVPKPTPIASAPPMNAKTVSGMRARLSVTTSSANPASIMIQRRSTFACASLTSKRLHDDPLRTSGEQADDPVADDEYRAARRCSCRPSRRATAWSACRRCRPCPRRRTVRNSTASRRVHSSERGSRRNARPTLRRSPSSDRSRFQRLCAVASRCATAWTSPTALSARCRASSAAMW